jgi:uncharacterized protein (TIGR00369 family)
MMRKTTQTAQGALALDKAALQAFLNGDFGPLGRDFRVERAELDGLTLRLLADEKYLRPGNTVSGPALFGLADVAVYLAILSRIGMVPLTVTTNCSMDFMRKPQAGRDILAHTRVLKLGRSLAVGDALLFIDGDAAPVARASLTYAIPKST